MQFCPKCGAILKPKTEGKRSYMVCSCGYSTKNIQTAEIKEKIQKDEKEIAVVSDDDVTLPSTEAECPKCKHKIAFYWMIQTRAGDEPETKFFKCEKCKHVWRDYG